MINQPYTITFGKYTNQDIHDVYLKDPKFVFWLACEYRPNKNLKDVELFKSILSYYKELYPKEHPSSDKSTHVLKPNQEITIDVSVYQINSEKPNWVGYKIYRFLDKNENRYVYKDTSCILFDVRKGDELNITAKRIVARQINLSIAV